MVLKYGLEYTDITNIGDDDDVRELDPFVLFTNAIRSKQIIQKYQGRLNTFFEFIFLPSSPLDEKMQLFINNCRVNPQYPLNYAFKFTSYQKQRFGRLQIRLINFCEELNSTNYKRLISFFIVTG